MKYLVLFFIFIQNLVSAQEIKGVQLINPKTNDPTPVISFGEYFIFKFDDISSKNSTFHYTIQHLDRNWVKDELFFTEFAEGSMNGVLDQYDYSFGTQQQYRHYQLQFPNKTMRPIISGNYQLIIYTDSPEKPLIVQKFCIVEEGTNITVRQTRTSDAKNPQLNQRVEVRAIANDNNLLSHANSLSLNVIQNNNWNLGIFNQKPTVTLGNKILFQQLKLSFPGNNEFYYFNNREIDQVYDRIANTENDNGVLHTFLHPIWAFPLNYQDQPDVNGAYYFRVSDKGTERNPDKEGDYSWVHFYLESAPMDKNLYVLGLFNNYEANAESKMVYNDQLKMYEAKIYLKQGFYNYILATSDSNGTLNYSEINGNFWQTQNLYQAFLYYRPFGKNYDGLIGYGEYRPVIQ